MDTGIKKLASASRNVVMGDPPGRVVLAGGAMVRTSDV